MDGYTHICMHKKNEFHFRLLSAINGDPKKA